MSCSAGTPSNTWTQRATGDCISCKCGFCWVAVRGVVLVFKARLVLLAAKLVAFPPALGRTWDRRQGGNKLVDGITLAR